MTVLLVWAGDLLTNRFAQPFEEEDAQQQTRQAPLGHYHSLGFIYCHCD